MHAAVLLVTINFLPGLVRALVFSTNTLNDEGNKAKDRRVKSFLPFSVFLQALIQGVALVVNAIAEALAGFGASVIAAAVRAL